MKTVVAETSIAPTMTGLEGCEAEGMSAGDFGAIAGL
jgi:hypothetical protein